jgi:hypothetical protein
MSGVQGKKLTGVEVHQLLSMIEALHGGQSFHVQGREELPELRLQNRSPTLALRTLILLLKVVSRPASSQSAEAAQRPLRTRAAAQGARPAHQANGLIHDAQAEAEAARVLALAVRVLDGLLTCLLSRCAHKVSWRRTVRASLTTSLLLRDRVPQLTSSATRLVNVQSTRSKHSR